MKKGIILTALVLSVATVLQAKQVPPFKQADLLVQSSALSFDSTTLYLTARTPWSPQYDIYTAQLQDGAWLKAERVAAVSSDLDEMDVSISADEQDLYFVRREQTGDGKKETTKTTIFSSHRNGNTWTKPEPLLISTGEDICPVVMPDNETIYFLSSRKVELGEKQTENYSLFFTRKIGKYNLFLPTRLAQNTGKGEQWFSPRITADKQKLAYTRQFVIKKDTFYKQDTLLLTEAYQYAPVMTLRGTVLDEQTQWPLAAQIFVKDALTGKLLATHHTYASDGSYRIALAKGKRYDIDITATRYSHRYLSVDCRQLAADDTQTENITLTPELHIRINLFDSELQTPVAADKITIRDAVTRQPVEVQQEPIAEGSRLYTLPIGKDYELQFQKRAYATQTIHINTQKAVLMSRSELDVDLQPGKQDLTLQLIDKETGEKQTGTLTVENQHRREQILPALQSDQTYTASFRQENDYHLTAEVEGYLFVDTIMQIAATARPQTTTIWLTPLQTDMVVQMQNIQFEYNSYELTEESFPSLDKVADLLEKNPTLQIELGAHTDDIGGDQYNNLLSERRGQAAAQYIIRKGISPDRIKAVGYGKKHPLVPNDSDENRAINRRVEFKVIGI